MDENQLTGLLAGIEYSAEFVPLSRSRNAGEKHPTLNWKVTLTKGRRSLTVDYSQGGAFVPGYNYKTANTRAGVEAIKKACETGKVRGSNISAPGLNEVLSCLLMDSEVLDFSSFEEWATDFGYDTDSRKAERLYNACLKTALQLRAILGEENMNKLRNMLQDC